jgi:hypothetical protein
MCVGLHHLKYSRERGPKILTSMAACWSALLFVKKYPRMSENAKSRWEYLVVSRRGALFVSVRRRLSCQVFLLVFGWSFSGVQSGHGGFLPRRCQALYSLNYWERLYRTHPTPWSRVLPGKLNGSQLVKKFPTFYVTRRFITAFTSARYLSDREPEQSGAYPSFHFLTIHFNIIVQSKPRIAQSV